MKVPRRHTNYIPKTAVYCINENNHEDEHMWKKNDSNPVWDFLEALCMELKDDQN